MDNNENNGTILLDSSLILTTKSEKYDVMVEEYDIKIVECGNYCQLYLFNNKMKHRKEQNKDIIDLSLEKINKKNKINDMFDNLDNNDSLPTLTDTIQLKNITRSKLECQRLAKANMEDWKSFITLTFEENIIDLKEANKKFRYYIDKIQRLKKDFKYLCITEFQKRGAIHYHLLTNLECNSKFIPKQPIKSLYNPSSRTWKELEYYDLPYWIDGYSSAEPMDNDSKKVVGYISKYMTKDVDNRLFNRHRYFYSRNLNRPKESYINIENIKHSNYLKKIIQDKELIYQNEYANPYDNNKVSFLELLKK